MSDAFRLYGAEHPALARTLRAKLTQRRNEVASALIDGYAQDWADYNRRAGVMEGLRQAIEICIDTEKEQDN